MNHACFLSFYQQVDMWNRTPEVDLSNYVSNGEWELIEITIQRNVVSLFRFPSSLVLVVSVLPLSFPLALVVESVIQSVYATSYQTSTPLIQSRYLSVLASTPLCVCRSGRLTYIRHFGTFGAWKRKCPTPLSGVDPGT